MKYVYSMVMALLLTGCATHRENAKIHPAVIAKPSSVVMAQVSGIEKPDLYKIGNQGLLDMMINDAMTSSVTEVIQKIDGQHIVDDFYFEAFERTFDSNQFKVKKAAAVINRKDLKEHAVDEAEFAHFDFRSLKNQYDVEYALILQPRGFGAVRQYHGFIPLGAPKGLAELLIYLVKLDDNSLVGYYNTAVELPVKGDWDNPPRYSAMTTASKRALKKALVDAHQYLFNPMPNSPL